MRHAFAIDVLGAEEGVRIYRWDPGKKYYVGDVVSWKNTHWRADRDPRLWGADYNKPGYGPQSKEPGKETNGPWRKVSVTPVSPSKKEGGSSGWIDPWADDDKKGGKKQATAPSGWIDPWADDQKGRSPTPSGIRTGDPFPKVDRRPGETEREWYLRRTAIENEWYLKNPTDRSFSMRSQSGSSSNDTDRAPAAKPSDGGGGSSFWSSLFGSSKSASPPAGPPLAFVVPPQGFKHGAKAENDWLVFWPIAAAFGGIGALALLWKATR